jgi:hypothetical protein
VNECASVCRCVGRCRHFSKCIYEFVCLTHYLFGMLCWHVQLCVFVYVQRICKCVAPLYVGSVTAHVCMQCNILTLSERTKSPSPRVAWHVFPAILPSCMFPWMLLTLKSGPHPPVSKGWGPTNHSWGIYSFPSARSQPPAEEWNGTHTLGLCPRRGGDEASEDFWVQGKSQGEEESVPTPWII